MKRPFKLFLDPVVDKQNYELIVALTTNNDEQELRRGVAERAVEAIIRLANIVGPEDLYCFVKLPNQREQDAALVSWATAYFQDFYEKHYSRKECAENEELGKMFVYYCQRILSMAFHELKFLDCQHYCSQNYAYRACLGMYSVIKPWLEEQAKIRQQEDIKARANQFKSPDQHLETSADLSASEKMQVFNQSLMARNRVGMYDERGRFVQQVVKYNQTSSKLVREFFQLNPKFTVQHLNQILDECVKLPEDDLEGNEDPQWHARNGRDITKFIRSLDVIASQLNILDQLPDITPLPIKEDELECPRLNEA